MSISGMNHERESQTDPFCLFSFCLFFKIIAGGISLALSIATTDALGGAEKDAQMFVLEASVEPIRIDVNLHVRITYRGEDPIEVYGLFTSSVRVISAGNWQSIPSAEGKTITGVGTNWTKTLHKGESVEGDYPLRSLFSSVKEGPNQFEIEVMVMPAGSKPPIRLSQRVSANLDAEQAALAINGPENGSEPDEQRAEPLHVQIEVTKEAQEKALVPIRIQITNKTGRGIYLPFNLHFLPEFDFLPKGPALGYVTPPWSPSIEEESVYIESGKTFSATTDLALFVRLVNPGPGEVEYQAKFMFSDQRDLSGHHEKFTAKGAINFTVTPEMVQTVRGALRPTEWTLKCTESSYEWENTRHYGIALEITYSGRKPVELVSPEELGEAIAILAPQTWVGCQRPQKFKPSPEDPMRHVIFGPGQTKNTTISLEDYFQPLPPGTYEVTVQIKLWTDDAKRKTPLVISAPLRVTITEN
jgi:hypothetical protein